MRFFEMIKENFRDIKNRAMVIFESIVLYCALYTYHVVAAIKKKQSTHFYWANREDTMFFRTKLKAFGLDCEKEEKDDKENIVFKKCKVRYLYLYGTRLLGEEAFYNLVCSYRKNEESKIFLK